MLPETINILSTSKLQKRKFSGCPRKFYHTYKNMYKPSSSAVPLPNLICLLNALVLKLRIVNS